MKSTLIAGFSPRPGRFSLLALRALQNAGHEVLLMGRKSGEFEGRRVFGLGEAPPPGLRVHTLTLYLRAELQRLFYPCFLQWQPHRIIFNPGTENPEFEDLCHREGIEALRACTLVMLSTGQY